MEFTVPKVQNQQTTYQKEEGWLVMKSKAFNAMGLIVIKLNDGTQLGIPREQVIALTMRRVSAHLPGKSKCSTCGVNLGAGKGAILSKMVDAEEGEFTTERERVCDSCFEAFS